MRRRGVPAMTAPAIMWFREDLRLADNPALDAAARSGRPLLCLHIADESADGSRRPGGAARWWLHGALASLDQSLAAHGGRLTILRGAAADILETLARDIHAGAVYWNRRYDAAGRATDAAIKTALRQRGVVAESFNGALLNEPWTVLNRAGDPFRVFSPYWRAVCAWVRRRHLFPRPRR